MRHKNVSWVQEVLEKQVDRKSVVLRLEKHFYLALQPGMANAVIPKEILNNVMAKAVFPT